MKRKIRVVSIIKTEDGILIAKRTRGRSKSSATWELPNNKIQFGEQPEEACARGLSEYMGLNAESIKIKDVITFVASEGFNRLNNLYIVYEVSINKDKKPAPRDRYNAYKFVKDFSNLNVRLSDASATAIDIINEKASSQDNVSHRSTANSATIYVDGASRGNPGPSGIGYQIIGVDGQTIEQGGQFIGFATSRVAEYYAMKNGIEHAINLGLKSVRFVADSLMVINQLNGIFTVKNKDIAAIYNQIQDLLVNFESVSFNHISRLDNQIADHEANRAIDNMLKK